jgi:hypothetical protein
MWKNRLEGAFLAKALREKEGDSREVSYPPCEVVEAPEDGGPRVVRCVKCGGELGNFGTDWTENCRVKRISPTGAGPLMKPLVGHYLLQQFYCPSCGALLQNELVEKEKRSLEGAEKTGRRHATPKGANKRPG